jgi:hypothetical protein
MRVTNPLTKALVAEEAGPPGSSTTALTATAVGAVVGLAAAVRRRKPLHPRGIVFSATLRRFGSPRAWGVSWLDEPGEESGVVRMSRSAGLPSPLPDVLGLAIRSRGPDGALVDLLLSTSGVSRLGRRVLIPSRHAVGPAYGSLLAYKSPRGPVLLAAFPEPGRRVPATGPALEDALHSRPAHFTLAAAGPAGPWSPFADLVVGRRAVTDDRDPDISFDPVLHPVPGLLMYSWAAAVRGAGYSGARGGRGAHESSLFTLPGSD